MNHQLENRLKRLQLENEALKREISLLKSNHLEELSLAKEKAKEANHLKSEFIKNMSHEIRTPMNGIIGFTELLNNPEIPEERRNNFSQIIINSCNQLLGIIDDIIDISALETKQEQLNESDFCLNDLILGVFSTFNAKSKERNLPIYVNKALRDTESHIISDKHKIRKILNCLLENAMKFTTAGYIEIGYHIEKENLVIYVKDTGIGISSESQKVIFDRFSKEDNKIPNMHGGLGLGLSISKEMAQLLGGTITLESEKEKGSTFYLTIPYKSPIKNSEIIVEDINKT